MYPSHKLAHSALSKKIIIVKNATAYTWDWYCHLVDEPHSIAAMTLFIMTLNKVAGFDAQHNIYMKCCTTFDSVIMPNVIIMSVILLSVIMLSVIMLSVIITVL